MTERRLITHRLVGSCGLVARSRPRFSSAVSFELGGKGGFIAAVRRLPQLDLQLATPPYSNGCYRLKCATFGDGSGIHQRTTQWLPLLSMLTEKDDVTCWIARLEAFFKVARIPDCEKSTVVFMYVSETPHGLTHETDYNVLKDSLLNQLRVGGRPYFPADSAYSFALKFHWLLL
ncbi:hypothetical protein T08_11803 [Trichinella sp. T8]|nr:hypothetical protein T08_11803 [Trichinella sp. T8]